MFLAILVGLEVAVPQSPMQIVYTQRKPESNRTKPYLFAFSPMMSCVSEARPASTKPAARKTEAMPI